VEAQRLKPAHALLIIGDDSRAGGYCNGIENYFALSFLVRGHRQAAAGQLFALFCRKTQLLIIEGIHHVSVAQVRGRHVQR